MFIIQGVNYTHPNRDLLFADLQFTVNTHEKIALVGNNGAGKSTLLKLMAGILHPSQGSVKTDSSPYYMPQLYGQLNDHTVAEALQVAGKIAALRSILDGQATEENFSLLDDDWTIEEKCKQAFSHWNLNGFDPDQKMATLSGGQKTKVLLAGITIHQPEIVLLDEPSNHLDAAGRELLYEFIRNTSATLVVVSHDRTLLNLLDATYELSKKGITIYGGNYNFYTEQKALENDTLNQELRNKEKALRKAKDTERETIERQQKLDARGKRKQEKAGLPTILMNTLRNNAEKSTSKIKGVHAEKTGSLAKELDDLRKELPDADKMRIDFGDPAFHKGKLLAKAIEINFGYNDKPLWKEPLDFDINSGDRIAIRGMNGSGKTTLIKMLLGSLTPQRGVLQRTDVKAMYIDQDYSLINNQLTVYEQAEEFNTGILQEHEIKIRLNRFLFTKEYWEKPCGNLSGGEKMRLMLCCLAISNKAPDLIILDEPTNNLDIQNIEILTAAINDYKGTLLVISHDEYFLREVNVERFIDIIAGG